MKKSIAMILTLALIFTMSFSSFALGVDKNYKTAQKNYKDFVKSQLAKKDQEAYNSEYGKIVKKEVTINKLDDFEAVKESFIKPVVIYEEVIILEKNDTVSNTTLMSESSVDKSSTDTVTLKRSFIANFNATVELDAKLSAERIDYEYDNTSTYAYKMKKYELSWTTDNEFTGSDGAGVYKADVEINQSGVQVGSGDFVNEDFTVNFDERESSDDYTKTYSNTAYSVVAPIGGLQAVATVHVIFAAGPGGSYEHTEELKTGWGYL